MEERTSDICAVVPAAGFGRRMMTTCPKQYLLLGIKTILEHAVTALLMHPRISRTIIVLNREDKYFSMLPLANHPKITTVKGGTKRVHSVLAGVRAVRNATWVLVHDAVRPCLHQTDLERLLAISKTSFIGGILATRIHNTVKQAEPNKNTIACTVKRVNLWNALTPQFFPYSLLYNCLTRALDSGVSITDEASALEYCGFYPKLIEGRSDNIKVTYPEDLQIAQIYLKNCSQY